MGKTNHHQKEKYLINQCLNVNSLSDEEAGRLHGQLSMYIEGLLMQNEEIGVARLIGKNDQEAYLLDSDFVEFEFVEQYLIPLWLRTWKADWVDYESVWGDDGSGLTGGIDIIPFVYALSSANFTGDCFFGRLSYNSETYAVNGKIADVHEFMAYVFNTIHNSGSLSFDYLGYFEESGIPEHIIELLTTPEDIPDTTDVLFEIVTCFSDFDGLTSNRDAILGLIKLNELDRLREWTEDLEDIDLSDTDLSNLDLSGFNLTNADLSGADLTDANLTDINLTGANLSNADLSGADLTDADLTDADLEGIITDENTTIEIPEE